MGEVFQEFAEDGTPLLSKAQSERFVELLKKNGVLLPESKFFCMRCEQEIKVVGYDDEEQSILEEHDCPNPDGDTYLDRLWLGS